MSPNTGPTRLKNAGKEQSKYQRKSLAYTSCVFGDKSNQDATDGIGDDGDKRLRSPIGEEGAGAQDSSSARAQS